MTITFILPNNCEINNLLLNTQIKSELFESKFKTYYLHIYVDHLQNLKIKHKKNPFKNIGERPLICCFDT